MSSVTPIGLGPSRGLGLLDRAASALPAGVEEVRYGWRLRHADSTMWWAGATMAHGGATDAPLDRAVNAAEDFYADHRAPARFQVCPDCPAGLDAALAARGYQWTTPMSLQVTNTDPVADRLPAPSLPVRLDDHVTDRWFNVWQAVHAPDADPDPEWRLLQRVDRLSAYLTVLSAGQPVAVGRVVAEDGWAGVFGMATLRAFRRLGAGSAVLVGLARWAADQRAGNLYLQIEDDNAAARPLYAAAGFATLLRYHYRIAGP